MGLVATAAQEAGGWWRHLAAAKEPDGWWRRRAAGVPQADEFWSVVVPQPCAKLERLSFRAAYRSSAEGSWRE